jgi:hypothetical protein
MHTATEHPFARDPNSKGLVNKDVQSRAAYIKARGDRKLIEGMQQELNMVREEIGSLRDLMLKILNSVTAKG